jgi:repressor LexA
VPLLGPIAAGIPIPTHPDTQAPLDVIDLTEDVSPAAAQPLRPARAGQSMIDALINDGDIVVLEPRQTADPRRGCRGVDRRSRGDHAQEVLPGGRRVRLQPMNSTMDPIYEDADNVQVQGRLVATIRSF